MQGKNLIHMRDEDRNKIRMQTGNDWHAMESDRVLTELGTSKTGLPASDVASRRDRYGENVLSKTEERPKWRMVIDQFASPLIIVLVICGIITLALGHKIDAAAIFIVLVLNAIIGVYQESKAAKAVNSLSSMEPRSTMVVRYGDVKTIDSTDVIPGDVILLRQGDRVPADARIIEASGLRIDESILTGESSPASKHVEPVEEDSSIGDRSSMAYSGTIVSNGEGRAVVVAIGAATELGKINDLVQADSGETPLQAALRRSEIFISLVVGLVAMVVFAGGAIINGDVDGSFLSAVSLMVAAMPEALPIVMTVAMALGVSRMAKERAIVRTLPSVETLGAVTVVGSDKTGTLTMNKMTVEQVTLPTGDPVGIDDVTARHGDPLHDVLYCGAMTNDASRTVTDGKIKYDGDAVDMAMMAAADETGVISDDDLKIEREAHLTYEPELLYSMDARRDREGRLVQYVKGAPDKLMSMSTHMLMSDGSIEPINREAIKATYARMAANGLRVIGLASKMVTGDVDGVEPYGLVFLGMEGMMDPPRPGVAGTIGDLARAGVRTIMITGDHPLTASAIGKMIGLGDGGVLTGSEMRTLGDDELAARLSTVSIVARVSPEDKLRVINALKDSGEVVAVTGDGVNDAPALKAADVGVSMGMSGTDAAKDASDVILTDDSYSTMANAVRQGRVTFKAIRGSMMFLLSTAVAAMIAVAANVLSGAELLFLPVQMLWINFVTNGVQDIALGFEPGDGTEMDRDPEPSGSLLSAGAWSKICTCGLWMAAVILIMFNHLMRSGTDVVLARTMTITLLVLFNFMMAMSSRSESKTVFRMDPLGNRFLTVASIIALIIHAAAMYVPPMASVLGFAPMTGVQWLVCLVLSLTVLIMSEGWKLISGFLSSDNDGVRLRAVRRLYDKIRG